ncbi:hypothetical protein [Nocardia cyriacigeorgica]|uniref:hypothetical protein n=1 Tax=Nocardia cyriacigeorgica TaxID=135487 RepID=UPI0024538A97|nr:hypothetical protein [Nocardia cyriacigeorgica]
MTISALPTGLHPPDHPRAAGVVEQTRIELTSPEAIAMIADYAAFQFASKWCLRNREDFVLAVRTLTADFVTSAATLAPRPTSVTLRLRWTAHGAIAIDLWDNVDPYSSRRYRRCLTTRLHLQRTRPKLQQVSPPSAPSTASRRQRRTRAARDETSGRQPDRSVAYELPDGHRQLLDHRLVMARAGGDQETPAAGTRLSTA